MSQTAKTKEATEKITLTPDAYEWFANYLHKELAWGVFHVALDDGNYECDIESDWIEPEHIEEWPGLMEKVTFFNQLSYSQRKKLGEKAQKLELKLR